MGICSSSQRGNIDDTLKNNGQGLPPINIIPQPIEVLRLNEDFNEKIINQNNPNDKIENTQNQIVNSNNSAKNLLNQPVNPSLNNLHQNINNSLNKIDPLNQSLNPNVVTNLDKTIGQTQLIKNEQNIVNSQIIGQSNQIALYQSQLGNSDNLMYQRFYLVVQLPQREIDITKLYGYNTLLDIEPYIAPDSIDEYDFYDDKGHSIENYLYIPFYQWHNIQMTLRIRLIRTGLNTVNDIRNYISRRTFLIGCLTFDKPNTFGLFIFNKMNISTLSFEYSTNIFQQLKTVTQFSAFCNALNKLYISGGELDNNQATNAFICIDLNEVQQNKFFPTQLCNLQKGRYWHSMIFIPEKYIFIVGGPLETNVELYDIDKNITRIDSKLNTERCEPSLILVNNKFLYAICGFQLYESFINTIERCNIHKRSRFWEMVQYKLNNTPNLISGFFGVSYISNNIILVSDKQNENDLKPNYILCPGKGNIDTISAEGILNSVNSRLFAEKFFIPFTEEESINLAFKSGEPKIFILNNENGAINELCLKES